MGIAVRCELRRCKTQSAGRQKWCDFPLIVNEQHQQDYWVDLLGRGVACLQGHRAQGEGPPQGRHKGIRGCQTQQGRQERIQGCKHRRRVVAIRHLEPTVCIPSHLQPDASGELKHCVVVNRCSHISWGLLLHLKVAH